MTFRPQQPHRLGWTSGLCLVVLFFSCLAAGSQPSSDPCAGLPADAAFVVAKSPTAGAIVTSPFEVTGCSRTFESTVNWRLLGRDGRAVAEGFTSGGGVDGPGPFRFTVEADAVGLHHLEVEEPKTSEEGFPPGRTVLPLVLSSPP